MTRRVVLIGHPVAHSLSGAMQQAAFDELGIIQLPTQERHSALGGALLIQHGLLFATAGFVELSVTRLVVCPRLPGTDPAPFHPPHRTVDVEHLEHHLQA